MKSPISSSSSSSSFINSRRNRLSPFLLFTLLGFIAFVVVTIYGRLFFFKYQFHQITTTSTTTTAPSLHSLNKPVLSQPDPPHIFPPPPPPPPPILTLETPEKKEEYIERVRAPKLGHGPTTTTTRIDHDDDPEEEVVVVGKKGLSEAEEQCDLFNGRWVMDESNRPLYEEWECPYIQPQLTCQEHGRPDKEYQKWRWQPHGCDLPSFNATFMLEKLRGKRMMFVGDSLNRGQYVSMVCLLHRLIPEHAKFMKTFESLTVFRAKEYNATIEFYWAPFLLESNSDNAVIHRVTDRIVRKGSINKHGRHWQGVDVLVFNTYLWWITGSKMKILRGSFNDERKDIIQMETEDAYRMAMKSMLKWVEKNVDQKKTRVFFTSMSPSHAKSVDWGGDRNGNCYNETTPIEDPSYWGVGSRKSIMRVIGDVFSKSKVPITFLNITQLSEYRKDAHTSIYKKQWNPLTPEQLANPASYADCTHWCLPGLQDTWNELLYAKLFYP